MDNEFWKDVIGYEGLYQVSNLGRIKSVRNDKIRLNDFSSNKYLRISLWKNGSGKKFQVHRLVAQAFIPNPENKPFINHKDGNKQNNHVENLEWCTSSENQKHRYIVLGHKGSTYGKHHNEETRKNMGAKNCKKVLCVELNKVFESATEASLWLNQYCKTVATAIHNGYKCGGYTWKYIKKGE